MDRRTFIKTTGACVPWSILATGAQTAENRPIMDLERIHNRNQNRSTVVCTHGMVCASQPLATMAGIDILQSGGNAIDAAIGTNATLGVVEPPSNGIGGDLFAIVWIEKDRQLYGLNASGRSAYNWSLHAALKMGLDHIPDNSPLAWSVPGCVSGWGALHERFGKKTFAEILDPAIQYAEAGFPLSPIISRAFQFDGQQYPTLARVFQPGGVKPRYGDVFRNPVLAQNLKQIAQDGPAAFYRGEMAAAIVKYCKASGGRLTLKDFEDHTATWIDPVRANYRGYDVWELPPNGQGIAALQILNILETFDIPDLAPNSAAHLHLFVEAKKLAFEDRARYYADPDFADVPVEWLISKEYARQRAALIRPDKVLARPGPGDPVLDSDTVYLTAADPEGNMISLIQSIYAGWGSAIVPEGLGGPIQNRGASFALQENHPNRLEPHKRPFHTIIPAFMSQAGQPVWSFGVMGGDFQPQGHAQVVMNTVDFGMSPQQAGEQPRLRHSGSSRPTGDVAMDSGHIQFERGFPAKVRQQMASLGHQVRAGIGVHGGYQSIWREENPRRYFGASDPRKDGLAIGY